MIRSIGRILIVVALVALAVWFFRDASTFALRARDPEAGRERGCYTDLEILFNVKNPTSWVRVVEFGLAGICAFSAFGLLRGGNKSS